MGSVGNSADWNLIWSATSAVFTAVAAGGLLVAARQLRFEAWLRTQELWASKDFLELREWLLKASDRVATVTKDNERAKSLCRKLDEFARLIPYLSWLPWLGTRYGLSVWGQPLGQLWPPLKGIVDAERKGIRWDGKWDALARLGAKAARSQEPDVRRYVRISGVFFALVAVIQLARAVLGWPVQVAAVSIPRWPSVLAFFVTAVLAAWAMRVSKAAA